MSIENPGLFERRRMSAGKMPPWNWADTVTVGFTGFVFLASLAAVVAVLLGLD